MNLPSRLRDARNLLGMLDLHEIEAAVAQEARAQLVIIGPVNSGKSTLFNQLKGQRVSSVSAVPGTTKVPVSEHFGPFWLVDTPGLGEAMGAERTASAMNALNRADVVILVLDAAAGIRQGDIDLYREVRAQGMAVVPVLNKIDLIKKDLPEVLRDAERKLRAPLIPISAQKGTNIAQQLIPAVIDAHPRMAVTIGRSLPHFRSMAARRVIRESGILAAVVGAEPVPGLDIPLLVGVQVRMMMRLAAIYGETMSASRARELLGAIVGGVAIRYGAQELAKLVPGPGWVVAGAASATGTAALGHTVVAFLDHQKTPKELREFYRQKRHELRRLKKRQAKKR